MLDLFSPEERAHIIHRLGWLNVWSPLHTDGGYQLCLDRREEVRISSMMTIFHGNSGGFETPPACTVCAA